MFDGVILICYGVGMHLDYQVTRKSGYITNRMYTLGTRDKHYPEKTTDLPQSTDQLVNFAIYTLRQKFKSHPVFFSLFLKMKEDELGMLFLQKKQIQ
jgi:hypothetical protein